MIQALACTTCVIHVLSGGGSNALARLILQNSPTFHSELELSAGVASGLMICMAAVLRGGLATILNPW